MSSKFAKLNKPELLEEVALYQKAGLEVALTGEETKPELIEKLEGLVAEHGVTYVVTEEDLTNEAYAGTSVGDVVIIAESAPVDEAEVVPEPSETPVETPSVEEAPVAPIETPSAPVHAVASEQLWHAGKPVVAVENSLVNGKLYKRVTTPESTFLLTEDEYAEQVKAR